MRGAVWLGVGLLAVASMAAAQTRQGLLPEDQAYRVSASVKTPGTAVVQFEIAPHYYLYRGQMHFYAGNGATLGQPVLPPGKKEHDQYLGDVVIYHNSVTATVPYTVAAGATSLDLTVGYQGCHEVRPKLCYPPTTKTFKLPLPTHMAKSTTPVAAVFHGTDPAKTRFVTATYTIPAAAPPVKVSPYGGSPAAQAAVKTGDAAQQAGKIDAAIRAYKKAITLDPNYAKAQQSYVQTVASKYILKLFAGSMRLTPKVLKEMPAAVKKDDALSKKLIMQYDSLGKAHPRSPVYPWILGQLYDETNLGLQKTYCQESVRIDPNFARGWECLGHMAILATENAKAGKYFRRAMEILPNDGEIASRYAFLLTADGKYHGKAIGALLLRFPKNSGIGMALVNSAKNIHPEADMVAELERLRRAPPASNQTVRSSAARVLYHTYLSHDLDKAEALARDMGSDGKNKRWTSNAKFVSGLLKAQAGIDAGNTRSALASLKTVKKLSGDNLSAANQWYLLDAKALVAAGKTKDAVQALRDRFVAHPSHVVLTALVGYGAKLGQSHAAVENAIWKALRANAKPAHPFTLKRLDHQGSVSLSDYRGKPVIVDFWYPNCGPCRASFPYLDKVAVKFMHNGLTVLAVNGIQKQQPAALPYLRGMGYHFVGLAGNRKFAKGVYGVVGFPTTYFIGPKGRILFKIHLYDDTSMHSAEAAVQFMLTRATKV